MADLDEGFAAALELELPRLTRVAYLLTGEAAAADDAVGAATERVLLACRKGGVDDPIGYLRAAVVNEVRADHHRRSARTAREIANPSPAPSLQDSDRRLDILQALGSLGARQRAVVVLRYFADLTEVETARRMGIRVGTVKSQASRALNHLRPLLEESDT